MKNFVFNNCANGTYRFQKILYTFEPLLFKRKTYSIFYAKFIIYILTLGEFYRAGY